jgi:putative phosphoribosyl transferase
MALQLRSKRVEMAMPETATLIPLGNIELAADISIPDRANSVVLFAHGSGSSRHSPRNRQVAGGLNRGGIGTILVDLLTEAEESVDLETAELRFDIPLLGRRLGAITGWIHSQPDLKNLRLGYFGASTGAAAALMAAADRPKTVHAMVSRGGRPDLAGAALQRVEAPTLFIVGGDDPVVLDLNYWAMARLPHETVHKLEIIPGAGHLFEEPGALDKVAALARDWFHAHLCSNSVQKP